MTEAELLLTHLLECERLDLYLNAGRRIPPDKALQFAEALRRRGKGEPLQYITASTEFMGLAFEVDPSVLIPRPETELLVETALSRLGSRRGRGETVRILDAGTGSGCIAVSLAVMLDDVSLTAVDISRGALDVARRNARAHRVEEKIDFIRADFFFSPFSHPPQTALHPAGVPPRFNLIISNPPYIPAQEIDALQPEVRYEPRQALDGGADGLDCFRALFRKAPRMLTNGGLLLIEIGCGQMSALRKILHNSGNFEIIEVVKDYAGIERVVILRTQAKRHG
ncbi:MAG: peptide chain release factor N(5)-glutamine methyltransferase [Candidatus Omnitrophica bacterium]|nr:peptide chain release factor N(5)-glutamine methyltransferase [Candidatus Omnitrophota bacterium]